jgi:hypothetical protein
MPYLSSPKVFFPMVQGSHSFKEWLHIADLATPQDREKCYKNRPPSQHLPGVDGVKTLPRNPEDVFPSWALLHFS